MSSTQGFGTSPALYFLARMHTCCARLALPRRDIITTETLSESLWWLRDVSSIEFIGPKAHLDSVSITPIGFTLVDTRRKSCIENETLDLGALNAHPLWTAIQEKAELMLKADANVAVAAMAVNALQEGLRSEYLSGRHGDSLERGFSSFLMMCMHGNYPCAIDRHGVVFVRCA